MNLLFCINQAYINLLLVCLRSILLNGGGAPYTVYILHSDLSTRDTEKIEAALPQTAFHFIKVDESIFEGFPEVKRYPRQIYYRLIAPLLLPQNLDRILYLDVDLVVINSLEKLYNSDFDGSWYIACSHADYVLEKINQLRYRMPAGTPYINTGVILMNLEPLRENVSIDALRRFVRLYKHTFILPDQDILFALYGTHIKLEDALIYNLNDRLLFFYNADMTHTPVDLNWIRAHSVIIHYIGRNKPWKKTYVGLLGCFYREMLPALPAPEDAACLPYEYEYEYEYNK